MTISNYYVREYLHLYREYRKVLNLSDFFSFVWQNKIYSWRVA